MYGENVHPVEAEKLASSEIDKMVLKPWMRIPLEKGVLSISTI